MPCDTIQTSTVEMANVNLDIFSDALTAAGYTVQRVGATVRFSRGYGRSGSLTGGTLTIEQGLDGNEIKRTYSEQVVKVAAKKMGWTLSEITGQTKAKAGTVNAPVKSFIGQKRV